MSPSNPVRDTTYLSANAKTVKASLTTTIESGSPDATSKASPRLTACIRSDRKLSASARVANVRDFTSVRTLHRTVYDFRRFVN